MTKPPGYNERGEAILAECNDEAFLKAARQDVLNSLEIIKSHRNSDDARVSLNACKEHLMLAGLYTQKIQHSGGFSITNEHADKVLQSAIED